jgi:ATP-dependent 26S proteasome regulatory subunit
MNAAAAAADSVTFQERQRAARGSAIEPMTIDKSVTFDHVGGLHHHVKALREMIVFPLM